MARLQTIELYLSRRKKAARNGYPQAFAHFGRSESFAVRYFDASPEHKSLLEKIQADSERMRANKIQQYRDMRSKHAELSRQLAAFFHDQVWDEDLERDKCIPGCTACRLVRQMSALKICVFEQSLPAHLTVSKAITFEISVPQVVVVWRDVISRLFLSVLRDGKHVHRGSRLWYATEHSGLSPFRTRWSRLRVASRVKPVEASHYRDNHITHVFESSLIVRHS